MCILADYHFEFAGYTANKIIMNKRFKNETVEAFVSENGKVNRMNVNSFIEHILLLPLPESISIIPSEIITQQATVQQPNNEEV